MTADDPNDNCRDYIKDLFSTLRALLKMGRAKRATASGSEADAIDSYDAALINVLDLMQRRADQYNISRESLGMAGYDPLKDFSSD